MPFFILAPGGAGPKSPDDLPHDTSAGSLAAGRAGHRTLRARVEPAAHKRAGRIGDTPLIGAGTYADDLSGAASCTGVGEAIIRVVMAKFARLAPP